MFDSNGYHSAKISLDPDANSTFESLLSKLAAVSCRRKTGASSLEYMTTPTDFGAVFFTHAPHHIQAKLYNVLYGGLNYRPVVMHSYLRDSRTDEFYRVTSVHVLLVDLNCRNFCTEQRMRECKHHARGTGFKRGSTPHRPDEKFIFEVRAGHRCVGLSRLVGPPGSPSRRYRFSRPGKNPPCPPGGLSRNQVFCGPEINQELTWSCGPTRTWEAIWTHQETDRSCGPTRIW